MDTRVKERSTRSNKRSSAVPDLATSLLGRLVRRALESIAPAPTVRRVAPLIEALEPRVLLAADPVMPRVDGHIDVPGEVDRYSFSLKNDVRIVFDSLTADPQMQWSLQGPGGSVVPPTSMRSADSADIGGNTAIDLKAGDYTLSVDGTGDHTGD
jgi:hypothetical protein